jgi:MFS family permease
MDRVHIRWGTLLATLFTVTSMGVLIVADSLPLALLFALLYGLGTGGWTIAHTLLFSNYFGREHLGSIRGFAQTVAGPVGAVGPLVAGYLQTYSGSYTISFQLFLGALLVVAASVALAVPPIHPSRRVGAEPHRL